MRRGDPDTAFPALAVVALKLAFQFHYLPNHARAEVRPERILEYVRAGGACVKQPIERFERIRPLFWRFSDAELGLVHTGTSGLNSSCIGMETLPAPCLTETRSSALDHNLVAAIPKPTSLGSKSSLRGAPHCPRESANASPTTSAFPVPRKHGRNRRERHARP
jgi:hypothetical protein